MQSNPHVLTPPLEVSPKQLSNTLACEDDYIQCELKRFIPGLTAESIVYHPSWVHFQSSHIYKGLYILVKYDTMHPVFGKIIDIVTVEDTVTICVIEYYGDILSSHYNAFIIKSRGVVSAISMHSLADHRPFCAQSTFSLLDNDLYITLPYYFLIFRVALVFFICVKCVEYSINT